VRALPPKPAGSPHGQSGLLHGLIEPSACQENATYAVTYYAPVSVSRALRVLGWAVLASYPFGLKATFMAPLSS